MFAFFLASQLTIAGLMQMASIPGGLLYSELLLFAAPAIVWCRATGFPLVSFLKLRPAPASAISLGLLIGAVNFLGVGAMQAAAKLLLPDELARSFDAMRLFEGATRLELGVLVAAVGIVAPVCEELAFRGYLQTVFAARLGTARAIAVPAILFALLHLDPVGLAARIELGVVFGLLVAWTGSLWPAVAAHAANNLLASGVFLYALGRADAERQATAGDLAQTFTMGAASLLAVYFLMTLVRRSAVAPAEPEASGEHRFDPRRVRLDLAAWGALMLGAAVLLLALGSRSLQVNLVDASVSVKALEKKIPETSSRKAFEKRLHAERLQARKGLVEIEDYRALRERLAALAERDEAISDAELERAFQGAEGDEKAPAH